MCGRGQTRDSASSAGTERRLSFRIATPAYAAGQPAAVESGDDLPTRTIMQPTTPLNSPIPVPEIDSDEPVPVIPTASVAPLDGPPDGERINLFTLAPREPSWASRAASSTSHQRCIYTLCYAIMPGSWNLMLQRRSHGAGWLREGLDD